MYIRHLGLLNFRTYRALELDLPPGLVVFHGANAQGKTNLMEACHLLALARSFRAENDRELVHWQAAAEGESAIVSGVFAKREEQIKVVVGLQVQQRTDAEGPVNVRKQVRLNGVPRLASTLVSTVSAVLFTAADVDLVLGSPSARRRYLDTVASQADPAYLHALQRYLRVLNQRNHLLRALRDRHAKPEEMVFWDEQLIQEGGFILERRAHILKRVVELASSEYRALAPGEDLAVDYVATVKPEAGREGFQRALDLSRSQDMATGATHRGPHRDDLRITSGGADMTVYASRGQARTIALAMHLAQAAYLREVHGEEPILLLDDVLSELDMRHRDQVIAKASEHQQALITTSTLELVPARHLAGATRFEVHHGTVTADRAGH